MLKKFPVKKIDKITIGYTETAPSISNEEHKLFTTDATNSSHPEHVILWNKHHYEKETNFLVASTQQGVGTSYDDEIPVNMLAASIPVFFSIDETMLFAYAYNYKNQRKFLENIVYRELVSYLASTDLISIMGHGRLAAKTALEKQINEAINRLDPPLGVKIHFVGLMEIHPPVEIAGSFQDIAGAEEEKNTRILQTIEASVKVKTRSLVDQERVITDASIYQFRQSRIAAGEVEQYRQQLKAFNQAPSIFKLRSFLDVLENETRDVRKYIIASTSNETIIVDAQQKLRLDLLEDLDLK